MKQNNVGVAPILSGDQSDDKLNFYQKKMRLITESNGIYSSVHKLVEKYFSNADKDVKLMLDEVNEVVGRMGTTNANTLPLCFSSKSDSRMNDECTYNMACFYNKLDDKTTSLSNSDDVRENVRNFVYHLANLIKFKSFADFAIEDNDNFNVIKNILLSEFVVKREGVEEFFLNFDELVLDLIGILDANDANNKNKDEIKNLILDYLTKVDSISPKLVSKLFKQKIWTWLKESNKVNEKFIVEIFNKLYLKPFFSLSFGYYHDEPRINFVYAHAICKEIFDESKNTMSIKIKNAVQPILIEKWTEALRNNNISLSNFFNQNYPIAKFLLDYCTKKNDDRKTALLKSLKEWAQNSLKETDGIEINYEILENKIYVDLFSLDDDLRNIFKQIKSAVLAQQQKREKNFIKNNPMDNYEKRNLNINIKNLILLLSIYFVCISLIIIGLITIPVFWPKLLLLIPLFIMCVFFSMFIETCKQIEKYRRRIAIQDIKNSKTKLEARNKIPFDMFWRKEVKDCFNQLPESENSPNEIHT